MKIYLARHGHAVEPGPSLPDALRFLSPSGRHACRNVGLVLARETTAIDVVLTSPLVRAVQTAELLAAAVGPGCPVEVLASLQPGHPPHLAAAALGGRGDVAVVGHEPTLSALGALLVGLPSFPPLRPGQVSLVEDGRPVWYLHPETLAFERLLVGT